MTRRSCSSASAASRSSSAVREDVARRVLRVAEQEGPAPAAGRGEVGGEAIVVEGPTGRGALGRDGEDRPGHRARRVEERRVGGHVQREERVDRRGEVEDPLQAVDDVAHLAHVLRLWRPAEAGGHALGEEGAQRRGAAEPVGVAEVAGVDEAVERGDDRGRRGEVHVGHPGREAVGPVALPLRARLGLQPGQVQRVEVEVDVGEPRSRPAAAWDLLPCAGRLQTLDRLAAEQPRQAPRRSGARARRPAARSGPWAGGRPSPSPGGRAPGARSRRTSRRTRTTAGRGRRGGPRPPASGRRGARRRAPDGRARCRPAPTPRPAPRARPPRAARSCAGRPRPGPSRAGRRRPRCRRSVARRPPG